MTSESESATALETERLLLREPNADDADLLSAYFSRNEPRFAPWDPVRAVEAADYVQWARWRRGESAQGTGISFLAFDRERPASLVAQVNLYDVRRAPVYSALLGYGIDGAYEGRGFASEAVRAVIEHSFRSYALKRIVATYDPANVRSGALLRKLGFSVEGYQRDGIYLRERWRDLIMTGLLNPDWIS